MRDPERLYQLNPDLPDLPDLARSVLLCSLDGYIDAGGVGTLLREHLAGGPDSRVVATFDVDVLLDYRSRRPAMLYLEDRWESYDAPELTLRATQDAAGVPYLLLTGPEPDYQWERFVAAVRSLVKRLDVRLTVGFHGIPMAVPHSRPIGLTAHATRPELITGHPRWLHEVRVPGNVSALLELRLGQAGHDALGFAVHVPHYLAQAAYPAAALAALDAVGTATGLVLPTGDLRAAAERTQTQIARQVAESDEVAALVRMLEEQYDSYLVGQEQGVPTGDELAAQFERFLAERDSHGDTPDR